MKITLNHISFWHAMQRQPSWAIRYYQERGERWPSMFKREKVQDRLKVYKLIPPEHNFDKDFHLQNLMNLLKSCAGTRVDGMIFELSRLSVSEHQGDKEKRFYKKWLKRIVDGRKLT